MSDSEETQADEAVETEAAETEVVEAEVVEAQEAGETAAVPKMAALVERAPAPAGAPPLSYPMPNEWVVSCGHGGPDTELRWERLSQPEVERLRLGGYTPYPALWRVTCASCAASSVSPRMVWAGTFSEVRKGFMDSRGALF